MPSSGFCAHVVVINPLSRTAGFTMTLRGLPSSVTTAQRLFDQIYTVNISAAGVLTDGLAGMAAGVFRFGCEVTPLAADGPGGGSVVHNGDFEAVSLTNPLRFGGSAPAGRSLYPGVGASSGWKLVSMQQQLFRPLSFAASPHAQCWLLRVLLPAADQALRWAQMHGNLYLPAVFAVQQDDFRASIRPDTAAPYHGRHCLRLRLPGSDPAIVPVNRHQLPLRFALSLSRVILIVPSA